MIKHLLLCAALALPSAALGDVRASYTQDGRALFSFAVPDFWSLRAGGERNVTAPGEDTARETPQIATLRPTVDPEVWMGFFSPRGIATLDAGEAYLSEIGQFLTSDPQISSISNGRIGGLPARIIKGDGRRDGRKIFFSISVLDLPGSRVAIAAGVAEAGADEAVIDEMNRIFASVRAAQ